MDGINAFEQAVLEKLLAGNHPVLVTLRVQARSATVWQREYTGVGFVCDFDVPANVPPVSHHSDFHLGDVIASVDGLQHGAGFVLFVRNGRLATLEGHTYEEPWPERIVNLKLSYQREPRELPFG